MKKLIFLAALTFSFTNCATLAPYFMKAKKGTISHDKTVAAADKYFWDNFHAGNYDSIPQMLNLLNNAYLKNNKDVRINAHLGFTHAWALSENEKQKVRSATVIENAPLAKKYFGEAVKLDKDHDWRYYGFWASFTMTDGSINGDMREMTRGYFRMKKAVRKYPEFNLFTAAYTMAGSRNPKDRKKALDMLWKNLDECYGEKVDRKNLDMRKYLNQLTTEGKKSTCWNTWIAPHNLEGFLLIMGDILAKKGDFATALRIYQNAKVPREYDSWDFKPLLEARIAATEKAMNEKQEASKIKFAPIPSCMICHQDKKLVTPDSVHFNISKVLPIGVFSAK